MHANLKISLSPSIFYCFYGTHEGVIVISRDVREMSWEEKRMSMYQVIFNLNRRPLELSRIYPQGLRKHGISKPWYLDLEFRQVRHETLALSDFDASLIYNQRKCCHTTYKITATQTRFLPFSCWIQIFSVFVSNTNAWQLPAILSLVMTRKKLTPWS
jgi:hypothetical protein